MTEKPILILGRVAAVAEGIAKELESHGIHAVTSTDPEHADTLFDPHDYRLVVFGSGAVGPVTEHLRREFGRANPNLRFLDAFAPVAVRQILSALDPAEPRITDPRLVPDADGLRLTATIRAGGPLRIEVYRTLTDAGWNTDVVADGPVKPGPFDLALDPTHQDDAFMVVLTAGDEFHLLRLDSVAAA
ncbi:hypothetical protein [Actinokineospora iranica]|uniref:Uncharacterized protein n=1 Tax=Actinokineospora iranica TaxID=1271860 RepID=A0A1G6MWD2_9PSEU|nr:hypothetical protein [Actinokineospora iranica]SDC59832.1 hypothetical protein SAMN05216174_10365 [Actinokineospora iranica]